MNAFDGHFELAIPARLAQLEARVRELESALAQLRGEEAVPAFDLWMLRTQAMPPITAIHSGTPANKSATAPAVVPAATVIDIDPALFKTRKMPQTGRPMAPAGRSAAQPLNRTQPLSAVVPIALPATSVAPVPPSSDGSMGFTAAFSTLDAKVSEAAAAECMIEPASFLSAPAIDLSFDAANRPAAGSTSPFPAKTVSALEQHYPSVLQKIAGLWQVPQARGTLRTYVKKLVDEDRGTRHGFDPAAITELKLLTALLAQQEGETRWGMEPETA